ncbi:hypothetical protein C7U89_30915 [Bradyrhizobium sp. WBOS4]|nr:hypothetical protein [Bradyrhizobium sp. WBOS8]MDD1587316.1 hypothetical protein [Bradyrhizobium sp. WBOS4]UUO46054.1 hypothetical protein DCM78_03345 [Bradyrhizobium sp. WBOS04]UUO59758.1 hypothetical protein DCM80_11575 [Bradyrhizobium sp. WBOS08]
MLAPGKRRRYSPLSCPAQAGHPVRRSTSVRAEPLRSTGSPAFAGDDRFLGPNDLPNTFAPEGAQRCRALTSGLQGRSAGRKESLSEKVAGLNAAPAQKSRKVRVPGRRCQGKSLKRGPFRLPVPFRREPPIYT